MKYEDDGGVPRLSFDGMTPRACLIAALAAATNDAQALAIVEAIDTYLGEDEVGRMPVPFQVPSRSGEMVLLQVKLNEATARAEKAEAALAANRSPATATRKKMRRPVR